MVSPPQEENGISSEKKSVSSVLFLDPSKTPTTTTTTPTFSSGSLTSSPAVAASPANNNLLPSQSSDNEQKHVVLDVNDENISQSIDTSSTISPSKVKNMSQEDLELGLGFTFVSGGNSNNNASMARVLRNVYNNVVGKKAAALDFSSISKLSHGDASRASIVIEQDNTVEEKKGVSSEEKVRSSKYFVVTQWTVWPKNSQLTLACFFIPASRGTR